MRCDGKRLVIVDSENHENWLIQIAIDKDDNPAFPSTAMINGRKLPYHIENQSI